MFSVGTNGYRMAPMAPVCIPGKIRTAFFDLRTQASPEVSTWWMLIRQPHATLAIMTRRSTVCVCRHSWMAWYKPSETLVCRSMSWGRKTIKDVGCGRGDQDQHDPPNIRCVTWKMGTSRSQLVRGPPLSNKSLTIISTVTF